MVQNADRLVVLSPMIIMIDPMLVIRVLNHLDQMLQCTYQLAVHCIQLCIRGERAALTGGDDARASAISDEQLLVASDGIHNLKDTEMIN